MGCPGRDRDGGWLLDRYLTAIRRVETAAISCKTRISNCVLAGCHSGGRGRAASYTAGIHPVATFSFSSFSFLVWHLSLFVRVGEFPSGNRDWSGSLFDRVFDRNFMMMIDKRWNTCQMYKFIVIGLSEKFIVYFILNVLGNI